MLSVTTQCHRNSPSPTTPTTPTCSIIEMRYTRTNIRRRGETLAFLQCSSAAVALEAARTNESGGSIASLSEWKC
jgi:hypothetical protein